ncbi:YjgN family protein [Kiloniella sp. b19]|uniref:YjgN family protein n=1 Tax=Kiloniella sp. GXU_MW_B19 TaxID=3141326 RepID=UPI0031E25BF3
MTDLGLTTGIHEPGEEAVTPSMKRETGDFKSLEFTGTGREYFGIWLGNIFLSIITLGIYSAWAKVRNKQYFYGHTRVLGDGFGYHATGMQIFKGRLIIFAVLGAIFLLSSFLPLLLIVLVPVLLGLYPVILNRSMAFDARVTSWRTIRFGWHGTYFEAFCLLYLYPVAAYFSFGLALPWVSGKVARYLARNRSLGQYRFDLEALKTSAIYRAALSTLGLGVVTGVAIVSYAYVELFSLIRSGQVDTPDIFGLIDAGRTDLVLIQYLGFGLLFLGFVAYQYQLRKLALNVLTLDRVASFRSEQGNLKVVGIVLSNVVLFVLTLGLATPWLAVRLHRYLTDTTAISVSDDLPTLIAQEQQAQSAASAEFMDMNDFDIGAGL